MQEPKRTFRSPKGGYIAFNHGTSTRDCVIRYSTDYGANLEFKSLVQIPDRFTLNFDDRSPARPCVVMWKLGTTLAVQFGPTDSNSSKN